MRGQRAQKGREPGTRGGGPAFLSHLDLKENCSNSVPPSRHWEDSGDLVAVSQRKALMLILYFHAF